MLKGGTSSLVKFTVDVMGSRAVPSRVRVILGEEAPELSFIADRVSDSEYQAEISVPNSLYGKTPFKVEVVVNNRLFTPIDRSVEIEPSDAITPAPVVTPEVYDDEAFEDLSFDADDFEELIQEDPKPFDQAAFIDLFKAEPKQVKKIEVELVETPRPEVSNLKKLTLPKHKFNLGLPSHYEGKPIPKVELADIDVVASKILPPVAEAYTEPNSANKTRPRAVLEAVLTKGQIVYE